MIATRTRTVGLLVVVCVAVLGLLIAPIASGAVGVGIGETESETAPGESASNASVSSFMQSTAADAEHTVESGLFDAKYENADDDRRAGLVTERVDDLETKATALEAEREELRSEAAESNESAKYQARLTRLTVEISGLERAIDRTEQRAAETGVEDDRFAELEANTNALAGPDITERAQGLAGFDRHPGAGHGPSNERATAGAGEAPGQAGANETPPGQERANGTPGQDRGQSNATHSAPGQGNETPAAGNGTDRSGNQEPRSGTETGPDEAGPGSGSDSTSNSPGESDGDERGNQSDEREDRDTSESSNGQGQGPPTEANGNDDSADDTVEDDEGDDDDVDDDDSADTADPSPDGPPEHATR